MDGDQDSVNLEASRDFSRYLIFMSREAAQSGFACFAVIQAAKYCSSNTRKAASKAEKTTYRDRSNYAIGRWNEHGR